MNIFLDSPTTNSNLPISSCITDESGHLILHKTVSITSLKYNQLSQGLACVY